MEDFYSAEEDIDDEDPFVGWSEYVLSKDWDLRRRSKAETR